MRSLWGQPRPSLACTSNNISSFDELLFRSTVTILNFNYSTSPFSLVLSLNVLALLPCQQKCFEAYKGPKHRLNHLFRTHHLQGLVAMLTSFSDASGSPGSTVSILAVRPIEVGRSSPPNPATGPFCLYTSLHPPHRCSFFLSSQQHFRHATTP